MADSPRRGGSKFGKFRGRKPQKPEQPLEYKNIEYLSKFVGPTGKILSRRRTGFEGQDQRELANAIKLARFMALLPYTGSVGEPRDSRDFRDRDRRDGREPRGRS